MIGCRYINDEEINKICSVLSLRNHCLFVLGIRTGFRINELLSLNIKDVIDDKSQIRNEVMVAKRNTKGKSCGQVVALHDEAKLLLAAYLKDFPGECDEPLFRSTNPAGHVIGRLTYSVFRKAIKNACHESGVDPTRVSTHAMRKAFARKMREHFNDNMIKLQRAMRHKNLNSTASYMEVDEEEVQDGIRYVK